MTDESITEALSALEREANSLCDIKALDPAPFVPDYRGVAAYLCIWIPPELLRAGGLHPVLLRGESSAAAPGMCATCASFGGDWLAPVIGDVRLFAAADSCPQIARAAARASRERDIPLFRITAPGSLTDDGLRSYVHQLSWLRDVVRGDMPHERFEKNLASAFALYSGERSLLAALRRVGRLPETVLAALQTAAGTAPPEQVIPLLERGFELARKLPPPESIPLLLVGGMIERDRFDFFSALDEAGVRIAADLLCGSGRGPHRSMAEGELGIFDRVALEHFHQLPCLPVEPNRRFYVEMEALVERESIRGMLYYEPRSCGAYRRERERLQWRTPVPVMYLDMEFMRLERSEMVAALREFADSLR